MAVTDPGELANLIREVRQRLDISQAQLAQKLKVSFQSVNRWENGRAKPLPLALKQIKLLLEEMGDRSQDLLLQYFPEDDIEQASSLLQPEDSVTDQILLVENHGELGDGVLGFLSRRYGVEVARDEIQAFHILQQQVPQCVLLNLIKPGIDGRNLLRQLRSNPMTKEIPVIVLCESATVAQQGLQAGADDCLIKPFSTCELLVQIEANLKIAELRQQSRRREEALQIELDRTKQNLETVLARIDDQVLALDQQWCYTYANDRVSEVVGIPKSELLGKNIWELFPDLIGSNFYLQVHQAVAEQTPMHFEYFYQPWKRWFENHAYPSPDGVTIFVADITERKQVEEALRESQQLFHSFMNNSPVVAFIKDQDGRHVYVNALMEKLFAAKPNELIGKTDCEVYPPDAAQQFRANDLAVLNRGKATQFLETIKLEDRELAFMSFKFPFQDATGRSLVAGMAIDVTEQRRIEEALRQQERRYRYIFETAGVSIWEEDFSEVKVALDQLKATGVKNFRQYFAEHPEFIQQAVEQVKVIDVNPVTLRIFEAQDKHELLTSLHQIFVAETLEVFIEELVTLAEGKTFLEAETRLKTIRGKELNVIFTIAFPPPTEQFDSVLVSIVDISERKQAEKALRESEQRLRLAQQAAKVGTWDWNLLTDHVSWSEGIWDLVGLTPDHEKANIEGWREFIHPDDREQVQRKLEAIFAEGEDYYDEFRMVRYDGSLGWLATKGRVIRGWDGKPERFIGVNLDITERKQAEEELQLRENRYRTLANAVAQLMWMNDAKGNIVFFNQRWQDYTNVPLELGVALWRHIIHPDDFLRVEERRKRAIEAGEAYEVECRLRRFDQIYRWHLARVVPFKDERGEIVNWFGTAMDIDEIKRVEAEQRFLAEASSALAASLDEQITLNCIAGLAVPFLADCCYFEKVTANHELLPVAGHYSNPEHRDGLNALQSLRLQALESEYNRGGVLVPEVTPEWLQSVATGSEPIEAMGNMPLRSLICVPLIAREKTLGMLTLGRTATSERCYTQADLTLAQELAHRAALALDNAQLYQHAQEANRIKDEFLAILSHELRSPLNPILGWTKLLRSRKFDAATTDRALATIERNAKVQTQLIDDLLDVARILRGKLTLEVHPLDLVMVIEAAIETVRLAAEAKSISIQTRLSRDVGQVAGDLGRLQQVVWNLLSNAVKFTSDGGTVEVILEQVKAYAQITVRDTGKGISSEFLPYIFDYFRQADSSTTRQFGGLGLGLAIVRHLVELHGGTVQAASPGEGQGATFTVRLPRLKRDMRSAPENASTLDLDRNGFLLAGINILVVDDEPDTRELIIVILEEAGASVIAANSAIEALEILGQSTFDVLVSDIGMPEMDGYTLMRQIASEFPQHAQMPAIALTAYAGEFNQQRAFDAGFIHHLAKPVAPHDLVQTVSSLVL